MRAAHTSLAHSFDAKGSSRGTVKFATKFLSLKHAGVSLRASLSSLPATYHFTLLKELPSFQWHCLLSLPFQSFHSLILKHSTLEPAWQSRDLPKEASCLMERQWHLLQYFSAWEKILLTWGAWWAVNMSPRARHVPIRHFTSCMRREWHYPCSCLWRSWCGWRAKPFVGPWLTRLNLAVAAVLFQASRPGAESWQWEHPVSVGRLPRAAISSKDKQASASGQQHAHWDCQADLAS